MNKKKNSGQEKQNRRVFCLFAIFSGLFLILSVQPSFGDIQEISQESLNRIKTCMAACNTRMLEIELETIHSRQNRHWLELKIKRIKDLGRPVPDELQKSMEYKFSGIRALEREKKTYQKYYTSLQNDLERIEKQMIKGVSLDTRERLLSEIKTSGLSDWLELVMDDAGNGYQLKTILPILFASGSAKISREYDYFLKHFAGLVKQHDILIVVDGYADIDPIHTRQYPSNFELGAARAANVVHALTGFGVDPSVFKIASTGEYRFPDIRAVSKQKSIERYVNLRVMFQK